MEIQYTNELTSEMQAAMDQPVFTEEQLAVLSDEVLAVVREQAAYLLAHPPIGIFRPATEGSQTREGGVITLATSPMSVELPNGQRLRVAKTGDRVVYPDGTMAEIISGAGRSSHFAGGCSIALVGSHLSNGDEIINTLQGSVKIVQRAGVPMAEDFLCLPQAH